MFLYHRTEPKLILIQVVTKRVFAQDTIKRAVEDDPFQRVRSISAVDAMMMCSSQHRVPIAPIVSTITSVVSPLPAFDHIIGVCNLFISAVIMLLTATLSF